MKKFFSAAILLIFVMSLTACNRRKLDISKVRTYSDPIMENILQSINTDDYEGYTRNFNDTMKNALTRDVFISQNKILKDKIGTYVSKEFGMAQREDDHIVVLYKTKFTKEEKDVIVKVIYENANGNVKVSGLFFDSPNLNKSSKN